MVVFYSVVDYVQHNARKRKAPAELARELRRCLAALSALLADWPEAG